MANQHRYYEELTHGETRRHLSKQWWIVLIVIGALTWSLVGAMGLMPIWLWAVLLGTMISTAFLIAFFAPRKTSR